MWGWFLNDTSKGVPMKLLHIDSAITGDASVSRKLSAAVVARLQAVTPGLEVVRRDLAASPLPYFSAASMASLHAKPEADAAGAQPSPGLEAAIMDEFMGADVIVVGAPLYNFTVPSQLKTWVDYLSIAGKTFAYTAQGPVGLVKGKRMVIASARGGEYGPGSPNAAFEHQVSWLRAIFGFMGVTDVTVVQAEGVRMGPEKAEAAMKAAMEQAAALAA